MTARVFVVSAASKARRSSRNLTPGRTTFRHGQGAADESDVLGKCRRANGSLVARVQRAPNCDLQSAGGCGSDRPVAPDVDPELRERCAATASPRIGGISNT